MSRLLLLFLAFLSPAGAAPLVRDLGLGLVYCRAHQLPADLPTDEAMRRHPCILDLRYVPGDRAAGATLLAWLKFHASARTPIFLLANADTGPALLAPLASPDAVAGLVILGPAADGFSPDIALAISPAQERRAYAALEKGAPIESLITEKVDKPRSDEAMLTREHLSDTALGDDDAPADSAPPDKPAPAPLIDAVLQRAVQLHRTLVALKRVAPA